MTIKLDNVSKTYKDIKALDSISLTIQQGMFGILGPNGAGKTTLMRTLMALQPADDGKIVINGIDIEQRDKIRECVSYLPQEFSFYASMTVNDAMDYMALLGGISNSVTRKKLINELLAKVNLMKQKRNKFKTLSGGMKRRLGIAIALLKDPAVLIVDEPTAGLDPEERVRFRMLLSEFAKDRIVLLSTHIVGDIEHSCKHIAILNQGKIIFDGEQQQLPDEAAGKVRELEVATDELSDIQAKYYVVSIRLMATGYKVKIITDDVIGVQVMPNVEDAYLVKMSAQNKSIQFKEQDLLC
ncbi:ABC transporter ATP-binding protein [Fusibacter ferrireducens]|uniref:ABC transporter ATP-binding protein n=1 Tax=Fusibacter ferrireducens TaxID=2785058 RepID=A0ABR9ZYH9_9FIRM|nr:ABC transporter ATP-binding protein [Fusibacter ferrireducens]MBF4695507.1 ABC transporter ATP-binding protein [Fusibacter ferrireducens]